MIAGFFGGYPVGAKVIAESYQSGCIGSAEARRMLGFCSNAGPAFIFGMIRNQFQQPVVSWCLMLIVIVSAILTGYLLPHSKGAEPIHLQKKSAGFIQNFNSSLQAIAAVCGWVILFRVILAFLDRWFLWLLPVNLQVIVSGILELSNGCIELYKINNDGLRFVIAAGMLSLGGLCVYLQTASLTAMLGAGLYFPGKIIQCLISIILSGIVQILLFDAECRVPNAMILLSVAAIFAILVIIATLIKNNSRNFRPIAV